MKHPELRAGVNILLALTILIFAAVGFCLFCAILAKMAGLI